MMIIGCLVDSFLPFMPCGVLHESGLITEGVAAIFAGAVEVRLVLPVITNLLVSYNTVEQ